MKQPGRTAPARRKAATIAFAGGALAFGIAACAQSGVEDEPNEPVVEAAVEEVPDVDLDALSEESIELLADDLELTVELARTLDAWFGDLFEPQYRVLPEWTEAEFDPNASPFDGTRTYEGFDEAELDAPARGEPRPLAPRVRSARRRLAPARSVAGAPRLEPHLARRAPSARANR